MGTKYVIRAESGGEIVGSLTRQTREGAFEAAETLLDARGEDTEVTISWETCGGMATVPKGLFE